MITLLIVFMTDIKPSHYHIWPVDLPRTLHPVPQPSAIREDSIRIFITREGNVFFRNYQIEPKDLPELIRDAVKNGSEKKAYVGVDRRAVYGDVKPVVEQIRASGVSDVCFLAVKSDLP
jgi:Biopolymer transport protein